MRYRQKSRQEQWDEAERIKQTDRHFMKYRISVEVGNVTGCQIFEVEALDAQEAKFKVARGEGEIIEDQLEVQSLEWHTATVIEEVPNGGDSRSAGAKPRSATGQET